MSFLNAKSIAVEGVGFGTKALSILGFKWFDISIEPPQPIIDGGGSGIQTPRPSFLVITIYLKNKTIRKRFEVYNTKQIISIVAKLKSVIELTVSFKNQVVNLVKPKSRLNKVEPVTHIIDVKQKAPEITIRRIK